MGLLFLHLFMEISREKAKELRELLEDSVEYFCDQEMVSGEVAWVVVECLAVAKQAELKGLVAA